VCAFCVNQHSCICHSFGPEPKPGTDQYKEFDHKRRDSVAGEEYPLCRCSTQKYFNSNRVHCEMNKFDAMMAYLAFKDPAMKQVVVVDAKLEIFSRAWVVAELIEAQKLCIEQRMKVLDLHSIRRAGKVQHIRVEHCQAARPEDVQEILSKIDDVPAFDRQLEKLIFGGDGGLIAGVVEEVRRAADTSSSAPLFMGRLWKLKTNGNPEDESHWFLRDMWITLAGSLCYFSIKENKRLVILGGDELAGAEIVEFEGGVKDWGKPCFEIRIGSGSRLKFACESTEEYDTWVQMLSEAGEAEDSQAVPRGVDNMLHAIKIAATNRRIRVSRNSVGDVAVLRGQLWKLKVGGDPHEESNWYLRDVWIAPNGSLNYWSVKEEAALTYYTAADIGHATFMEVAAGSFAKPWAFEVRFPQVDVFEFAPGIFATESEELRKEWIDHLSNYSTASRGDAVVL